VHAALAGVADVSITVRMDKAVKKAIATLPDDAGASIEGSVALTDRCPDKRLAR